MLRRFLPTAIAVLFFLATLPVQAYEAVEEVVAAPTITYRKAFSIDAAIELWNRALDNPCLMGRLWEAYGFRPAYTVTGTDTGIRVSDALGITGDIRQIDRSDHARTLYAAGSFDHWAVPSFFTAGGVIVFECMPYRDGCAGEATVFLRGDNGISRFVMRLFSGILTRRIGNRTASMLENMEVIIRDIARDPRKVRAALAGEALGEFDRVFPAEKSESADGEEVLSDLQRRMSR
ncbi:MAG: hypothetical protein JXI32_07725 [Deltaproteobacteria bacterium]|nr:hypothetical protein [Deltaproteobacteria bacterium]